jgi:mannose-6-phosphate isomerase
MKSQIPPIILLSTTFKERIWGGQKLQAYYPNLPSGLIGESWAISAHPEGESIVMNTEAKGLTLSALYQKFPVWFLGATSPTFPLLIKLIDAHHDLSVQVHPDNLYALAHEGQFGKHESWLVLDASDNQRIQLGHDAKNKAEFVALITKQDWQRLLRYDRITKDEVIDIAPGTLHALCAGTVVLEVQQSSDVTYRVYDYDRLDSHGQRRPLHLPQAIEVTNIPFMSPRRGSLHRHYINSLQPLLDHQHYRIEAYGVDSSEGIPIHQGMYRLGIVIEGNVTIAGESLTKGQAFILPSSKEPIIAFGSGWLVLAQSKI